MTASQEPSHHYAGTAGTGRALPEPAARRPVKAPLHRPPSSAHGPLRTITIPGTSQRPAVIITRAPSWAGLAWERQRRTLRPAAGRPGTARGGSRPAAVVTHSCAAPGIGR